MTAVSILAHPLWPKLRPFVVLQKYWRDQSADGLRIRIELPRVPAELIAPALAVRVECVRCHRTMTPIRARRPARRGKPAGGLYYGCACQVDKGCSRGSDAANEYKRIQYDIEGMR